MKRIREVIAPEHKLDTTLPHEPFKDGADVRRYWELHAPQATRAKVPKRFVSPWSGKDMRENEIMTVESMLAPRKKKGRGKL